MKRLLLLLIAGCAAFSAAAAEPPKVAVSVAPIHSLVTAVAGDARVPDLLIPPGATPHSYALRPSDARTLAEADLVVWVGEELESVLAKPLGSVGADARQLRLMAVPGVNRLEAREGGIWEVHGGQGAGGHHRHASHDPHIWLAPANARAIVDAVASALAEMDPERAAAYTTNAQSVRRRIDALEADLRRRLTPVATRPYMVFHDAYHYFENAFGLRPVGAIAVDPDHRPGARRLAAVQEGVRERGALCVFSEPQFRSSLVDMIIEGTEAGHGVLDPVGSELMPGPELWFQLMDGLADSLVACLAGR